MGHQQKWKAISSTFPFLKIFGCSRSKKINPLIEEQ
jgi:hypothetical protein